MKKKKNTLLAVGLLVAVISLGIGYAISTQTLKVEGTATAQESGTSFNVKFTGAQADTELKDTDGVTVLASSSASVTANEKVATMNVTLTNVGNSQTVTFTVTNASQAGLAAKILKDNVKIYEKGTTNEYSSEYFDVATNIANDITIASGTNNTATFTVTVTLKKAYVGTDDSTEITEEFDVVLEGVTAVQETN